MRGMREDLVPAEHADWLAPLLPELPAAPERCMALAIDIAAANQARGGGPFGAVIADAAGELVALGWNDVVPGCDSTAHAEVVAIRRAQRALGSHQLDAGAPLCLYASCDPCIQCYGAIWWSGLRRVRSAASKACAEALGFHEGPVGPELWREARAQKGVVFEAGYGEVARAEAVLRDYARAGRPY